MLESPVRKIKNKAYQIGFDLCGITTQFEPLQRDYVLQWFADKKFAGMEWLGRNTDKRLNPATVFSHTKSVIAVATSYNHAPSENADYKLARYAHGRDYHLWMREKLNELADFICREVDPSFLGKSFVDTGPVLERDLAAQAGLGWIGKNTCLLNQEHGSYVFLGVLFCNLDLPPDALAPDQCLNCRLCLDACPTDALQEYQLDPQKCLAYHNIEKRGERESEYWQVLGDNLVGCDICQEVCPWNFSAAESREKQWLDSFTDYALGDLRKILQTDEQDYKTVMRNSAVSRIKHVDFMRNVFLVIANTRRFDLLSAVEEWRGKHPQLDLKELDYCLEILCSKKSVS